MENFKHSLEKLLSETSWRHDPVSTVVSILPGGGEKDRSGAFAS